VEARPASRQPADGRVGDAGDRVHSLLTLGCQQQVRNMALPDSAGDVMGPYAAHCARKAVIPAQAGIHFDSIARNGFPACPGMTNL